MTDSTKEAARSVVLDEKDGPLTTTAWGESFRVRVGGAAVNHAYAILDDRAQVGSGPPRHLHHNEDESFQLLEGRVALWTPAQTALLGPGDFIMIPKGTPHAWRALGPEPARMALTIVPGGFEQFFLTAVARGLTMNELDQLVALGQSFGMDTVGPPLSDDEVQAIVAAHGATA